MKEVSVRFRKRRIPNQATIEEPLEDPKQVIGLFGSMQREMKERIITVCLDKKSRIMCHEVVAIGAVDRVQTRVAEVFRAPIMLNASGVIILHNHPSGDPEPSQKDDLFTVALMGGARSLDIELCDHIIIGNAGRFYSYADQWLGWDALTPSKRK